MRSLIVITSAVVAIAAAGVRAQDLPPHATAIGIMFPAGGVEGGQEGPGRVDAGGITSDPSRWWWVCFNNEKPFWLPDTGQPDPFPFGWSVRFGDGPGVVRPSAGATLLWTWSTSDGANISGVWSAAHAADWDGDGATTSGDYYDFVGAFFDGGPDADFNQDGAVDSLDFYDYLAAFFGG